MIIVLSVGVVLLRLYLQSYDGDLALSVLAKNPTAIAMMNSTGVSGYFIRSSR